MTGHHADELDVSYQQVVENYHDGRPVVVGTKLLDWDRNGWVGGHEFLRQGRR